MVFGDIVEPTTRALIDEDLEEYPEYTESVPEWEGDETPPENIDTLVFIETERVKGIVQNNILKGEKPISKITNAGIEVFNIDIHNYLIVFSGEKEFTCGEVTQLFDKWIRTAKNIYSITSESIYNYQNQNLHGRPVSLIKMLSNDNSSSVKYDTLESPNLVTGLGASILTYCIHIGLKCNLFVVYVDTSPLDSLNMGPLLTLLEELGLPLQNRDFKVSPSSSNLYM